MEETVTKETIAKFLSGYNPTEKIIKIELDYTDDKARVFYRDEKNIKKCKIEPFHPFVWTKQIVARTLYNGNREELKKQMSLYNIGCKGLKVDDNEGNIPDRMENGYRVMFFAKMPMSFHKFMEFFIKAGRPLYPKETDKTYGLRDYIVVAPNEQHMMTTGQRLFKGYDDYDDALRFIWDLETEGLDPNVDMISQIGVRTNKGFEKIIEIEGQGKEKYNNEIIALNEFFSLIKEIDPDIITGHNTENFDWNFIDVRLQKHGSSLKEYTAPFFNERGIYKKTKQSVLKLGGEMEYYYPTIKYGTNITDSLHAVRRAQAIDSNMKKADLKYVTKYSKLNKPNRVYIPGKLINDTWLNTKKEFAHNDKNGDWFKITDKHITSGKYSYSNDKNNLICNETKEVYDIVTGKYIGQRYLLDDLYEGDKVELQYNQPNFLVGKMLPVSFDKMCTMGTAAIWKYIMLAWSYENDLAIPELIDTRKFCGGLSRLLSVGFVDDIVKLDYNSLYPSIILSYGIKSPIDITGVMNGLLEYILTQREHYKGLKGDFGKKAKKLKQYLNENPDIENADEIKKEIAYNETESARNDKMQLPLKIVGNAFFGSYGSGSVFPFSDISKAEETTCIGRMCLRLMISHFTKLGYQPIVGDSFTKDTPLFVKYDNGLIDIKPVSELFNEKEMQVDELNREYDYSEKNYKILCRSGWVTPTYIYRHKTNKPIFHITDNSNLSVDVTEDHSLFNSSKKKIKPSEINRTTELEYCITDSIYTEFNKLSVNDDVSDAFLWLMNSTIENKQQFIDSISDISKFKTDKVLYAKYNFIKKCVEVANEH